MRHRFDQFAGVGGLRVVEQCPAGRQADPQGGPCRIIDCYISRVEGGKLVMKKRLPKEELLRNMPVRFDLSKLPA
jgi:hypothetical protein